MPSPQQRVIVHAPIRTKAADALVFAAQVTGAGPDRIVFRLGQSIWPEHESLADAFVLPAYLHALHRGQDVHFDFAVSQRLLANINDALGPLLVAFAPDLFVATVRVSAREMLWGPRDIARSAGSATGMSCGLDSFATVHYASGFPAESRRKLTALAHFDVGNHSPLGAVNEALYDRRRLRAAKVAGELGLPIFDIRSNLGEWIPGEFIRLHTLRNASAAYLLSPFIGTYVYSNAVKIGDSSMDSKDSASIDSMLLPLLTTNYLEFIQGTPAWGAPEKTRAILDDAVAQAHFNVCFFDGENCGVCEKCLRRSMLIDSYGRLADFSKVFNLDVFRENRDWYVGFVLMREKKSALMRELAQHLRATGYLADGEARYRWAWLRRRAENWLLRRLGRPRRPL